MMMVNGHGQLDGHGHGQLDGHGHGQLDVMVMVSDKVMVYTPII